MLVLDEFLKAFHISKERFDATGLKWDDLIAIYHHHGAQVTALTMTGNGIAERLRQIPTVHSLKMRVKDASHLLEKIVRKKEEDPQRSITLDNYRSEITDLVGVRALHLFKMDWAAVHNQIQELWDEHEPPVAYTSAGDSTKIFSENGCRTMVHKFGYRSVHYVISHKPTREVTLVEIQVRTIFEEGWSEIDHRIRYPNEINNPVLSACLAVFNGLAHTADEMGSYARQLKSQWDEQLSQLE